MEAEVTATCTETGTRAHVVCTECGKTFESKAFDAAEITDLVIPATGHSGEEKAEVPATCTEAGTKAHVVCTECGKTFESKAFDAAEIEDVVIAAIGHDWSGEAVDGVKTCKNGCGATQTQTVVGGSEEPGDTPGEIVVEEEKLNDAVKDERDKVYEEDGYTVEAKMNIEDITHKMDQNLKNGLDTFLRGIETDLKSEVDFDHLDKLVLDITINKYVKNSEGELELVKPVTEAENLVEFDIAIPGHLRGYHDIHILRAHDDNKNNHIDIGEIDDIKEKDEHYQEGDEYLIIDEGANLIRFFTKYFSEYAIIALDAHHVVGTTPVTGVTLDKTAVTLEIGGTETLTATVSPANPTDSRVVWISDNEAVATVANGVVTAVSAGSANIIAKTADGDFTAICAVTVNSAPVPTPPSGGGGSSTLTVKFVTNADKTLSSVRIRKNATLSEPAAITKDGYVFDGWYTDAAFTEKYDFTKAVTKSFTLYAKWTKVEGSTDGWNVFADVKEADWFYEAVKYANINGLMNGVAATEFAPNANVTRGMFVTVLYRIEKEPEVNAAAFTDVTAGTWYADAVAWASENGITAGVSETEFAPDNNISREQIATMLYRYANFKKFNVADGAELTAFEDAEAISEYAIDAFKWAVADGIMNGKTATTLNPADNATRAETAALLMRVIEKYNK